MSREQRFAAALKQLGCSFDAGLKLGGDYAPAVQHGSHLYISGQVPRVDEQVVYPGRVGSQVSLAEAQHAAQISALRCLALIRQKIGSLEGIEAILRMTVFVNSADGFTQQSEVANGASHILHSVLGDAGLHTRTSVGVYQLPKNAPVEIDLIAVVA